MSGGLKIVHTEYILTYIPRGRCVTCGESAELASLVADISLFFPFLPTFFFSFSTAFLPMVHLQPSLAVTIDISLALSFSLFQCGG